MNAGHDATIAVSFTVPVIAIMIAWIMITAVVYGGFALVWPEVSAAEPWMHAGVYAFPLFGYLAHLAAWVRRNSQTIGT